jgi:type VI secretion system protein ImpA
VGTFAALADYQSIAALFEEGQPTGVDFRQDPSLIAVYREIKDMRSAARAEDRSRENDYLDDGTTRAASDVINQPSELWRDVHNLCLRELTTRTKDIELISWLAEATVRTTGIVALAEVFASAKSLITDHLDKLHPSSETDTPSDRISSLAGLNGSQDSDGTLVRPLYLAALAPDQIYGRACLWHFQRAIGTKGERDEAALAVIREMFSSARPEDVRQIRAAASRCVADINAIDSHLTEVYKSEAPSFRRLRDIFHEIHSAFAELGMNMALSDVEDSPNIEAQAATAAVVTAQAPSATSVNDREQAFQTLLQIAAFFRRTEPHSAIPLALETIVRRGRMDFMGLLLELVPDENQRREVLTRAGIEPRTTQDGGR